MHILIANVITPAELEYARRVLAAAAFEDGRRTAGWAAAQLKNNEQAVADVATHDLRDTLVKQIESHPVFSLAVRAKTLVGVMFSRYAPGHAYGNHVDNAIMQRQRVDVSFTLFLSDPTAYDGGELIIDTHLGHEAIKPNAGTLFAYPATTLHRVAPVARGERLAMVGWARSYVRDAAQRELLFDLETAQRTLFDRYGKSPELDLITKSVSNLFRLWADD
jgi:PKHD-type hydroxylase